MVKVQDESGLHSNLQIPQGYRIVCCMTFLGRGKKNTYLLPNREGTGKPKKDSIRNNLAKIDKFIGVILKPMGDLGSCTNESPILLQCLHLHVSIF